VRPSDLIRTSAFRRTIAFAGAFGVGMVLLAGFIYWQTVGYLTREFDRGLLASARAVAAAPDPIEIINHIQTTDSGRTTIVGLFTPDGHPLAGNMARLPAHLPPGDGTGSVPIDQSISGVPLPRHVRAATEHLKDGRVLVFGKGAKELGEIEEIVTRALALAFIPMAILALLGGAVLSRATLRRVEAVERACRRIMAGHLNERLPLQRGSDEFDQLVAIVNRMLDEIESLLADVKSSGDAIAHDLRTPLTRIRARLDRSLTVGRPHSPGHDLIERTADDIDQVLAIITAILRIGEIEHGRRRLGFRRVDLAGLVRGIDEFYSPVAEERGLTFKAEITEVEAVLGDPDLLFEAIGNVVDNATKFTPPGGQVTLTLRHGREGPIVRVDDTGPGIPPAERDAVLLRFRRGDQSRHTPGTGLGLSLVAAISRLHGFALAIGDNEGRSGCRVEICMKPSLINETRILPTPPVGSWWEAEPRSEPA
jgi:signal transduction histidine kinase